MTREPRSAHDLGVACKGSGKTSSKAPCAGCMEVIQERHIDAMERKGHRIRKPLINTDPPARKKKPKRKKTVQIGKRVV